MLRVKPVALPLLLAATLCCASEADTVSRILKNRFPEFRVVIPDEVLAEARDYYHETFPKNGLTCVAGDFDANGHQDYGVIALEKETGRRWFLMLFTDAQRDPEIRYRLELGEREDVFVSPLERGSAIRETLAIPNGKASDVVLENYAVMLTYFGKAAVAYFWDTTKRRVEHIQVSD